MCYWNVKTHFLDQKSTYKVWPILPPNAGFFLCERPTSYLPKWHPNKILWKKLSKTRTVSALNPNEPPIPTRGVQLDDASALHYAAGCGCTEICELLLRKHPQLNFQAPFLLCKKWFFEDYPFLKLTCPHMFPENWWLKDEVSFSDGLFSVSGRVPCFFGILKCFRGPRLYAPKVWLILPRYPRCHIEISQFSWLRGWDSFFSAKVKRSLDCKIGSFAQHGDVCETKREQVARSNTIPKVGILAI